MSFTKIIGRRVGLAVPLALVTLSGGVALAATGASGDRGTTGGAAHHRLGRATSDARSNAASEQTTGTWEVYTAPYSCGEFGKTSAADAPEGPFAPGFYQTTINVHYDALPPQIDPDNQPVITFFKKAVLDYAAGPSNAPVAETQFEAPNPYSTPVQAALPPDDGMLIDCQDIRQVLLKQLPAGTTAPSAPSFIEGDVVIMVPPQTSGPNNTPLAPLTISAVHTANSFNCVLGAANCKAGTLARTGITESVQNIQPTPVTNP
jgi:hypothetical protein